MSPVSRREGSGFMSWLRLMLLAALALLLAGCSAATSGPALNSELGGLREVHSVVSGKALPEEARAALFLAAAD